MHSAADFEREAARLLAPGVAAYVAGGAADEISLRENLEAFRRRRVRPRVLAGLREVDPATTMLGQAVSAPIGLAPTGANGLIRAEGELAVARAARASGLLYTLSAVSTRSLEEVAQCAAARWLQIYVHRDRGIMRALMQRARAAGYSALVLTVDMPVVGRREREWRSGFEFPAECSGNFLDLPAAATRTLMDDLQNATVTWKDLEWIRVESGLPLVVKGLLRGDDAGLAVEHGAAAVVVSNHGGRQLDRTPATLDVLVEVAQAVGGRAEVYLDGGVRRGLDVLIALALGARAAFIGRPYLAALAVAGEAGVARLLAILREELVDAMTQLGVARAADARAEILRA